MGIMNPYFPTTICLKLASITNSKLFVETGTYYGGTTKWAANHFKDVHTIELSEYIYNKTKSNLNSIGNITTYLGDSRTILPQILENINANIVFWLDGHYSGGETAGEENPCPLLKELDIILQRNNDDIIIIDDARCAKGELGWPSIIEIYRKVNEVSKIKRYLNVCDDHIYIVPAKDVFIEPILDYILERECLLWYSQSRTVKEKIIVLCKNFLRKTGTFDFFKRVYKKFFVKKLQN